jgi:hypothetical protein
MFGTLQKTFLAFMLILSSLFASAQTDCLIELQGDWNNGANLLIEEAGGITTNITTTTTVTFNGTGIVTFTYTGTSGVNSFSFNNCGGQSLSSGYLQDGEIQVSSSPLPVELLSFTAMPYERMVQLDWITAWEQDNKGFAIERSADGKQWSEIAFIDGKGFSNEITLYSYRDKSPFSGVSYYRLRQTDFDGTIEHSAMVAVDVPPSADGVRFVGSNIGDNISLTGEGNYSIVAVSGLVIQSGRLDGKGTVKHISMENQPSGLYFLRTSQGTQGFLKP